MDINEILLRITGDDKDASDSLQHIAGLLEALDHVEADPSVQLHDKKAKVGLAALLSQLHLVAGQKVDIAVGLDSGYALGQFAALSTMLETAGPFEFDIKFKEKDALDNIAAMHAAVDSLPKSLDIVADAHTTAAETKLALLNQLAEHLDGKNINLDVKTDANQMRAAEQGVLGFMKILDDLRGNLGAVGETFRHTAVNIGPFSTALNPVTIVAITAVLALITLLIGALGAVAASAAAAAAAVAGLASAFLAALGPAVMVVVAAALRLSKIFQALQAQDQARQQKAQQAAAGDRAAASAADARADANRNLQRANEDLARATVQAYRDMADAAEKVADAERGIARARLDREQANLSLEQARLNLQKFRAELNLTGKDLDNTFKKFTDVNFDPKKLNAALRKVDPGGKTLGQENELKLKQLILDIKQARLSQKEATDRVHDSQVALNRAQEDNIKYLQQGIKANQGYISALRARDDAQRALARANRPIADPAAVSKADAATQKLTKSEKALLAVIKQVRKFWNNMFGGATDEIMRGIAEALKLIMDSAKPLRPVIKDLGKSIADMIRNLATAFTDPGFIKQIEKFINLWIQAAGPLTNIIISLVRAFMGFATAAGPYLMPVLEGIANLFGKLAGVTEDPQKMDTFMKMVMANLQGWWYLISQVARVFAAFFSNANSAGLELVYWLGDLAKKLADFLGTKEGRQELVDWLRDAVGTAKDFVLAVIAIGKFLIWVGMVISNIARGASITWNKIAEPIRAVRDAVSDLWDWIYKLGLRWNEFWSAENLVNPMRWLVGPLGEAAWEIGKSIGAGLINGVKDMAPDFLKFFGPSGDLAGKVIGQLGKTFKTHSPSRVTMDIGENIVEGLKLGVKNGSLGLEKVVVSHLATPVISALPTPQAPVGVGSTDNSRAISIGEVNLQAPGNESVDGRAAAMIFMDELRRRGH